MKSEKCIWKEQMKIKVRPSLLDIYLPIIKHIDEQKWLTLKNRNGKITNCRDNQFKLTQECYTDLYWLEIKKKKTTNSHSVDVSNIPDATAQ